MKRDGRRGKAQALGEAFHIHIFHGEGFQDLQPGFIRQAFEQAGKNCGNLKIVIIFLKSTSQSRRPLRGRFSRCPRGMYETDPDTPGHLLAGSIYGPSYISFEYALGVYGMIPKAVYAATFEKKRKKTYQTAFGLFTYRDVPSAAFPLAIAVMQEGEYFYRIAEPEKALCDQLYMLPPAANMRLFTALLFDDLRINETELRKLDAGKTTFLAGRYHSTNGSRLAAFLGQIKSVYA